MKNWDKTVKLLLEENIVVHVLFLDITMDPFFADMDNNDNLKEELTDMQMNQGCETKFHTLSLSAFWCDQLVAYPGLATAAPNTFLVTLWARVGRSHHDLVPPAREYNLNIINALLKGK